VKRDGPNRVGAAHAAPDGSFYGWHMLMRSARARLMFSREFDASPPFRMAGCRVELLELLLPYGPKNPSC
jgi:hypothetical protein